MKRLLLLLFNKPPKWHTICTLFQKLCSLSEQKPKKTELHREPPICTCRSAIYRRAEEEDIVAKILTNLHTLYLFLDDSVTRCCPRISRCICTHTHTENCCSSVSFIPILIPLHFTLFVFLHSFFCLARLGSLTLSLNWHLSLLHAFTNLDRLKQAHQHFCCKVFCFSFLVSVFIEAAAATGKNCCLFINSDINQIDSLTFPFAFTFSLLSASD